MININKAERIMGDYMPLILATVRRFDAFEREEAIDEDKGTFGNHLKHRLNYYFWDKAKKPRPTSLDIVTEKGQSLVDNLISDDDIEDDFFTKEAYKDLYANIKKLDRKDVVIIKLKYWERLSDKKIAELIGLSSKTVRNRHSLALKKLRKMME